MPVLGTRLFSKAVTDTTVAAVLLEARARTQQLIAARVRLWRCFSTTSAVTAHTSLKLRRLVAVVFPAGSRLVGVQLLHFPVEILLPLVEDVIPSNLVAPERRLDFGGRPRQLCQTKPSI